MWRAPARPRPRRGRSSPANESCRLPPGSGRAARRRTNRWAPCSGLAHDRTLVPHVDSLQSLSGAAKEGGSVSQRKGGKRPGIPRPREAGAGARPAPRKMLRVRDGSQPRSGSAAAAASSSGVSRSSFRPEDRSPSAASSLVTSAAASTSLQETSDQDTSLQETSVQDVRPGDVAPGDVAQEAESQVTRCPAASVQLAASKTGVPPPAGSGMTNRLSARFGFGALLTSASAVGVELADAGGARRSVRDVARLLHECALHLVRRPARVPGQDLSRRAGDDRSRERGAGEPHVAGPDRVLGLARPAASRSPGPGRS